MSKRGVEYSSRRDELYIRRTSHRHTHTDQCVYVIQYITTLHTGRQRTRVYYAIDLENSPRLDAAAAALLLLLLLLLDSLFFCSCASHSRHMSSRKRARAHRLRVQVQGIYNTAPRRTTLRQRVYSTHAIFA